MEKETLLVCSGVLLQEHHCYAVVQQACVYITHKPRGLSDGSKRCCSSWKLINTMQQLNPNKLLVITRVVLNIIALKKSSTRSTPNSEIGKKKPETTGRGCNRSRFPEFQSPG